VTAAGTAFATIKFGLRCVEMIYFSLFQLILGFCSAYLKKVLAVFLLGLETCITCLGCINLSKLAGNDMIYLTAIG